MHCQYSSGHHYIKTSACNKAWPYIKTGLVKTLHLSCEATHMGYRLKFSEKKLLLAGSFEKSPSPLPVDGALSLPNPLPPIWKLLDVIIQKHRRGRWSWPSTMASATTSGLVRLVHCLGIIVQIEWRWVWMIETTKSPTMPSAVTNHVQLRNIIMYPLNKVPFLRGMISKLHRTDPFQLTLTKKNPWKIDISNLKLRHVCIKRGFFQMNGGIY